MMKVYYVGGSLGDAYVILCKVYRTAKREPVLLRHYTAHESAKPSILEIYSLVPGIGVEFRDSKHPRGITGQFIHHKLVGKRMTYLPDNDGYGLELECHPDFNLGDGNRFGLPDSYVTMQLESGFNPKKKRRIDMKEAKRVINNADFPTVLIGKDSIDFDQENGVIDLRRKTSIKEMVKIIRDSRHFYGCLGLLSLVALSNRVYSTLYKPLYLKDKHAYESRIRPVAEWKRYVIE